MKPLFVTFIATCLVSINLYATDHPGPVTPQIKSLSPQDIASIQTGKGWGMAKPAELNGYPGPRHLLDLADVLALSPDQRTEMRGLFDLMQTRAIAAGQRFLEAEARLEQAFRDHVVDAEVLKRLIAASGEARAELRQVHLDTHLDAVKGLSGHQIATYNRLRGYGADAGQHHSN